MESGLFRLLLSFLVRIAKSLQNQSVEQVSDYILNNADIWTCPEVTNESEEERELNQNSWSQHVVNLDTALLSILGSEDIPIENVADALDSLLDSSLFYRRLDRQEEPIQAVFKRLMVKRGEFIWSNTTAQQRRGYFLAGVGLSTGILLDNIANEANSLLIEANGSILDRNSEQAIASTIRLCELLFEIPPFVPLVLPEDWKLVVRAWLMGESLTDQDFISHDDVMRFVEDGMIYRLPWGLEAIRVRAEANNDLVLDGMTIENFEVGLIVPAIENGTLNRSVAMLMQSGFHSRLEAIRAVTATQATFENTREYRAWLSSDAIRNYINVVEVIEPKKAELWRLFLNENKPDISTVWKGTSRYLNVVWSNSSELGNGELVKLHNFDTGNTAVLSSEGEIQGHLEERYNLLKNGVYRAEVHNDNEVFVTFWGAGTSAFNVAADPLGGE